AGNNRHVGDENAFPEACLSGRACDVAVGRGRGTWPWDVTNSSPMGLPGAEIDSLAAGVRQDRFAVFRRDGFSTRTKPMCKPDPWPDSVSIVTVKPARKSSYGADKRIVSAIWSSAGLSESPYAALVRKPATATDETIVRKFHMSPSYLIEFLKPSQSKP